MGKIRASIEFEDIAVAALVIASTLFIVAMALGL